MKRSQLFVVAFLFFLCTVSFHCINLDLTGYDLDEAVHIWFAQQDYSEVVKQSFEDPNPPVYNLIESFWVKRFGVSEWTVRFFSVVMGGLSASLLFVFGARNFSVSVGIFSALLFAVAPIQFRFTHLARPYELLMVATVLSYGLLFELLRHPSKWKYGGFYLATTFMLYVHPTSIFNLPALALIPLFHRKSLRKVVPIWITIALSGLTFAAWYAFLPYFNRELEMWFEAPGWKEIWHFLTELYGTKLLIFLQIVLLALLGYRVVWGERLEKKQLLTALTWAFLPVVCNGIFSHAVKPIFQDKYLLTAHPGMMLLLAVSISQVPGKVLKVGLPILAMAISISAIRWEPFAGGDWRKLAHHIKESYDENTSVFLSPWYEFRTFAYYFDREGFEKPDSTMKRLAAKRVFTSWNDIVPKGSGRPITDKLHLVLGHGSFIRHEVNLDSLDKNTVLLDKREFSGVNLWTYQTYSSLQVLVEEELQFKDEPEGHLHINATDEFSPAVVVPLKEASGDVIRINAEVMVSCETKTQEAVLVVSLEEPGKPSHVYETVKLQKEACEGWQSVSNNLFVSEFSKDWILKAYVWNVGKEEMSIDNLRVELKN